MARVVADIAQAALFLEAVGVIERTPVREQSVFHAGHEDERELQALDRVQRHQLHAVVPGCRPGLPRIRVPRAREKMRAATCPPRPRRPRTPCGADEFLQVFDSRFGFFLWLLLEVVDEAAALDDVVHLFVQQRDSLVSASPSVRSASRKACTALAARPASWPPASARPLPTSTGRWRGHSSRIVCRPSSRRFRGSVR